MSHLLRRLSLAAAFFIVLFGIPAIASAASYYVTPNGSGSTCSQSSPCSLNTGLDRASAGDEVVLMDGRYRGLTTKKSGVNGNPITIRAANRHQAIVEWPYSNHRFGRNVSIEHDNIVVRGLKVDGKNLAWDNFRIGGSTGNPAENILIEDNYIVNGGHMAIGMFDTKNVIFRHNLIEDMGNYDENGEGLYLSSHNSHMPVVNVEIYGNIIRNITDNYIDLKGQARNVNVHHNIFERHRNNKDGYCGDGLVRSEGSNSTAGNYFQDNIVRDSPDACYMIRLSGNRVDILNNVFYKIGGSRVYSTAMMSGLVITGNTFCDTPTSGSSNYGSNNRFNAPQSACDAEVSRILNEMKSLPGPGAGLTSGDPPTPSTGTPCHTITSPQPAPAGFGVPYSAITSTHELLITAGCQGNDINVIVGNAQSPLLTYAWPTIHYWLGSTRKTTQLTCAESVSGWCRKEGSATFTADQNETWLIGYACQWDGSRWWCGCRTSQCTAQNATGSLWQAQLIKKP